MPTFGSLGPVAGAAHPVGPRSQDQPVQMLEAPARFHELDGQPIQELVMFRLGRPQAEVVHRADQRLAEMPCPDVVDRDARRQGVAAVDDPACQRQPPARADLAVRGVARSVAVGRFGAGELERARCVVRREWCFGGSGCRGALPVRGGETATRLDERRGGPRASLSLSGSPFCPELAASRPSRWRRARFEISRVRPGG